MGADAVVNRFVGGREKVWALSALERLSWGGL